jgi:phage terminase large subunit
MTIAYPATAPAGVTPNVHVYTHYGAASDLFWYRVPEVLMSGPAGTGKSRACLEKIHAIATKYPDSRHLFTRKTNTALSAAALVTYRTEVLKPFDGVTFFGGNKEEPAHYRYPNGSVIVVGGLDDSEKIMSTQYDTAYVQEATEVTEENIEDLTTRLRNGVVPYQQLIMDCNPQEPTHWLKRRCDRNQTLMLHSRHTDNPTVTEAYLDKLRRLTGVRYQRLYLGIWAAAEGVVYEDFDERIHVVRTLPALTEHYGAQDWGFTNPGVFGVFGVSGDGALYCIHEIYMTGKTVDTYWVKEVQALNKHYRLQTIQCDPSEPDYIQQYRNAGLPAVKAINAIAPGVGAVQTRLKEQRLFWWEGAPRATDPVLIEDHKPLWSVQEIPGYVWPKNVAGKPIKEVPAPGDDHGMDMVRYAVAYKDIKPRSIQRSAVGKPRAVFKAR